jgi:hypothetical protein
LPSSPRASKQLGGARPATRFSGRPRCSPPPPGGYKASPAAARTLALLFPFPDALPRPPRANPSSTETAGRRSIRRRRASPAVADPAIALRVSSSFSPCPRLGPSRPVAMPATGYCPGRRRTSPPATLRWPIAGGAATKCLPASSCAVCPRARARLRPQSADCIDTCELMATLTSC